jgi:CPA2 family monovalent cation:H+ antiporter-2
MAVSINIPVYSDALVVLGTAGVIVPLAKRWGLNPVLGYLAAGALLGPLGLGTFADEMPLLHWLTVEDAKNLSGFAGLGVVFLLFLIGLELSYERLMAMRHLVFGLGGLQIVLSTLLLASAASWAGEQAPAAIIIGASLALSSTAIVLEVLSGEGRLKSMVGRASFAVLLAQDLAVIPILMFISILGANAEASVTFSIAWALATAALALVLIVLAGRLFLRPLFRLVANTQSTELFIAALLFVIVATGVVAAIAGMSMALGAFVAGLLLAETEYHKAIQATVEPFKGLLLGLFFFTVGMGFDVRELVHYPVILLASAAGLIGVKAIILTVTGRFVRLSWPAAMETGLLLGPGGEFAFVAIGLAGALGVVTQQAMSFTFALTSLTMVLIPLLAIAAQRLAPHLERHEGLPPELLLSPADPAKHVIVVGYGRVGKVVCSLLKTHDVAYTATDHDPEVVIKERRLGAEVYYGDATRIEFLKACGIMEASGLIVTIHTQLVTSEIVFEARKLRPDLVIVARARDADHAQHLYSLGVTDAVPETVEASLQLSEAALVGLGIPTGPVIVSIHEERDKIRSELQKACSAAGLPGTRPFHARIPRRR